LNRRPAPFALILTALIAVPACGGDTTVSASQMPHALKSAIPQLERAGYEVRPELIGPDDVPVLVVNPDADGAARINVSGNSNRLPLSIDGVPADTTDGGTASLHESLCGRFSAAAPDAKDAEAALRASGLCS
jgi:hypothetical protein